MESWTSTIIALTHGLYDVSYFLVGWRWLMPVSGEENLQQLNCLEDFRTKRMASDPLWYLMCVFALLILDVNRFQPFLKHFICESVF